jgi:tryptophan 7-halogenase
LRPISRVIILGGGSAGFLVALALRTKMPALQVLVIRSPDIGIIGVGEGSTPALTRFLHEFIGIDPGNFFAVAQPTWKLGLRFLWGPRPSFNYTFHRLQLIGHANGLPKCRASYCWDEMVDEDPLSALMEQNRVFETGPRGDPVLHGNIAYHFENEKFVRYLEESARALGIAIHEDTVTRVEQGEHGIAALNLVSGRRETADLFVDASGFSSLLLGRTLEEPFLSYDRSLFCDRAFVAGWERSPAEQVIKPYTTCETMDAGWCWQIEHEHRIHRGYVYASAFISDDAAEQEFRAQNPQAGPGRIVRFISGRYREPWVKNVVAIGNASGFVEPLEATALGIIAFQSRTLADSLVECDGDVTDSLKRHFNHLHNRAWDEIRGFLAVHYRFNTRRDTPFWRYCHEKTELAEAEAVLELYRENGPTLWLEELIDRANQFGSAGYIALLLGQKVPYRRIHRPNDDELRCWNAERQRCRQMASKALNVNQTLALIRSPLWRWAKT